MPNPRRTGSVKRTTAGRSRLSKAAANADVKGDEALKLRGSGMSWVEVGAAMHVDGKTAWRWALRRAGQVPAEDLDLVRALELGRIDDAYRHALDVRNEWLPYALGTAVIPIVDPETGEAVGEKAMDFPSEKAADIVLKATDRLAKLFDQRFKWSGAAAALAAAAPVNPADVGSVAEADDALTKEVALLNELLEANRTGPSPLS